MDQTLQEMLHTIIQFIESHQVWAIPIVFLFAFGESLVIISLLVPGTAMLLGVGILIGNGVLSFMPVFISASIGAIIGDFISYWFGKHYHQQIISSWPLKKYPQQVFKAEQFFHRWGIFGVFIGRFFGPFRATVPLVAGAMHMPTGKFNIANVTSAPIWAFVLLAPGTFGLPWLEMVFG